MRPRDSNQYVCLTVKKKKKTCIYFSGRSPTAIKSFRQTKTEILAATPGPWIIVGDFNAHHSLWGSPKVNSKGRSLVSFACGHGPRPWTLLSKRWQSNTGRRRSSSPGPEGVTYSALANLGQEAINALNGLTTRGVKAWSITT